MKPKEGLQYSTAAAAGRAQLGKVYPPKGPCCSIVICHRCNKIYETLWDSPPSYNDLQADRALILAVHRSTCTARSATA